MRVLDFEGSIDSIDEPRISVPEVIILDSSLGKQNEEDEIGLDDLDMGQINQKNFSKCKSEKDESGVDLAAGKKFKIEPLSFSTGLLRGLLPPSNTEMAKDPTVVMCTAEHSYFVANEAEKGSKEMVGSPVDGSRNTLPFANESRGSPPKQTTIDCENSTTSEEAEVCEFVALLKPLEKTRVPKRKVFSRRRYAGVRGSDSDEFVSDDTNDKDYCPGENSSEESLSVGSDDDDNKGGGDDNQVKLKRVLRKRKSVLSLPKVVKTSRHAPSGSEEGKKLQTSKRISSYPNPNRIPSNFVSVHDLLSKLKKMQKLLNTKTTETNTTPVPIPPPAPLPATTSAIPLTVSASREKIPPPKLKRMAGPSRGKDFTKVTNTFFPMPNLTKMSATGNKNWKVRYMDSEVQNLGLDDLLLKASELNAENFTKALGQKMDEVSPGFNGKEGSEIVLTIPKSKRNSTEVKQYEGDESSPPKKANTKNFNSVLSGNRKEESRAGESKSTEEVSPKKTGIKVKTVENINEEFKDSLELKKKGVKDSGSGNVKKESPEGRKEASSGKVSNPAKENVIRRSEGHQEPNQTSLANDKKDTTPFVMTIVQGKSEKQRPTILRNSAKVKGNLEVLNDNEKESAAGNSEEIKKVTGKAIREVGKPDKEQEGSRPTNELSTVVEPVKADEVAGKVKGQQTKRKNVPFILNNGRKNGEGAAKFPSKGGNVKLFKGAEVLEKPTQCDKVFRVTSIEQKLGPKEMNKRFIKVVPYEPGTKGTNKSSDSSGSGEQLDQQTQSKASKEISPEKGPSKDSKDNHLISLTAFSAILKEILPEKWFLCLDKKYGLQIMKTYVDEVLNPSILISVVIARSGKLTVNVKGKQLEKRHQLFSNLCQMTNSENKLSLNYVLAILNKLRYLSVCIGCDSSLKKYSSEGEKENDKNGLVPGTQQGYRSPLCPLLVSLGKKRCYPCYRMNETLKKRHRRKKADETNAKGGEEEETGENDSSLNGSPNEEPETKTAGNKLAATTSTATLSATKGVKRNLEDFLEESFSTMKQQIEDELEKSKQSGEKEKALKAQEEVLSFMGLARKDSLGANQVRKSKRTKIPLYKGQNDQAHGPTTQVKKKTDQKELEFLEKYWSDINTLFSTSLLFGAYSRTGRSRLREKCRMFHKLLSTWREIVKSNPEWIGGEIVSVSDDSAEGTEVERFDKMDATALRAYIINSVKEVNRIKHKLRTRNSYFKLLYNKFVRRRMKRSKGGNVEIGGKKPSDEDEEEDKKEMPDSGNSALNTATDSNSDEGSKEKEKPSTATGPTTTATEVDQQETDGLNKQEKSGSDAAKPANVPTAAAVGDGCTFTGECEKQVSEPKSPQKD